MGAIGALPEFDKVGAELFDDCAVVGGGLGVDDIEDTAFGDYETMAKALAFWSVDAGFVFWVQPGWILAFVVAGEVADDEGKG